MKYNVLLNIIIVHEVQLLKNYLFEILSMFINILKRIIYSLVIIYRKIIKIKIYIYIF